MRVPRNLDAADFALSFERLGNGMPVLVLAGELDLYRAPDIEGAVSQMLENYDGGSSCAVDVRSVTFLDSSALAVLLEATRRQRAQGRELIVFVGPTTPTTAFEVTGADRVLAIRRAEGAPA